MFSHTEVSKMFRACSKQPIMKLLKSNYLQKKKEDNISQTHIFKFHNKHNHS